MPDLIELYFERDLTPAEEAELADLIQKSPSEAERFAQRAASSYAGNGLPKPALRSGWRWPRFAFNAGILLGLLGLAWWGWRILQAEQKASAEPEVRQTVLTPSGFRELEMPSTVVVPAVPREEPVKPAPRRKDRGAAQTTWDVRADSAKASVDVEVAVNVERQGCCVSVRIFDLDGRPVKDLFKGDALQGPKHLVWHGDDETGTQVQPGMYEIVMQTGARKQTKYVNLERK
jgi:hypothetical protein